MTLSAAAYLRTRRDPDRHPRHAVELGRWAGIVMATSFLREGIGNDDQLEPFLADQVGQLPPIDPALQPHVVPWRQLLFACFIREGVRRRFGARGVAGFDAAAVSIQGADGMLVEMGLAPSANRLEEPFTRWFRPFDTVMAEFRKRPFPTIPPGAIAMGVTPRIMEDVLFVEAFVTMVLREDPVSPLHGTRDDPRSRDCFQQLMNQFCWVGPIADSLAWLLIKDGIRYAMESDEEVEKKVDATRRLMREALEQAAEADREGEEWKG